MQVWSGMYQLSSWCKFDLACISCPADASLIWHVSVVQLMQVWSGMYQLSSWCKFDLACISCLDYFSCLVGARYIQYVSAVWQNKLDPVCIKPELSCRRDKRASYAMQNTSAQLLFHIRLDPLKLARDPLKVVAGSRTSLKYLLMGALPWQFFGPFVV